MFCFAKLTLPIHNLPYSVQHRRHHLTVSVKASNVHAKQMMCLEQTDYCIRLNPRVFANNNVKLYYFCLNFDSHNFTRSSTSSGYFYVIKAFIANAMYQIR